VEPEEEALGAWLMSNLTDLTIRAEILLRLSYLKVTTYITRPKVLLRSVIVSLAKREMSSEIKRNLQDLLTGDD
jgi:hypothetical protein